MGMYEKLALAIGLLVVVLAIALFGVWLFGSGLDQKGVLAARNPRTAAEQAERSILMRTERALARTAMGGYIRRRIAAAGMTMRVTTFLLCLTIASAAGVLFAWKTLAPLFGVLAIGLIAWIFFQFLRQREERRKEEFIGQLPELARVLSNAFSAGLALRTAVDIAAEELDDPARTELRKTADALKLGQSTEDALQDLGDRLPSRELGVLVSTLVISARAGGSMVTALRNISSTLDTRKETRREIKTVLAQATYTGYVVVALGIGMLFVANGFVEGGLRAMTSNPIGVIILVVSTALFTLGLFVINRMGRVEP